jgi:hypothetical protein
MKTILRMLIPFLILWGCATTSRHSIALQKWVGRDVNTLIQAWGTPTNIYKRPDGSALYTWWNDSGKDPQPGRITYAMHYYCKTSFTVDPQGIIKTGEWEGNNCD